jgi:tRNA (guanine-N7-)-methyltransferase
MWSLFQDRYDIVIVSENKHSRQVVSSQPEIHPRLESILETHLSCKWQAPLHTPSTIAFQALERIVADAANIAAAGLVLDSGCGTGESTRLIARTFPDCLVIGVDKSQVRLTRTGASSFPHREGNAIWLRADLSTFWRLAYRAGWRLQHHFLLYPNPWPKPGQLRRRWHAHPVFPDLLRLGGRLELRSNWDIYAQEFAAAANRLLGTNAKPRPLSESAITTPFERKYRASGHPLYSVSVSCDAGAV